MTYPINHIFQYPSGKWGFVGRVDCRLTWQNKDGTPLNDTQASELTQLSNPAMFFKVKCYDTREQALNAAEILGAKVTL